MEWRLRGQLWILKGARSGLLTHVAATESGSLLSSDEKLTVFVELEAATFPRASK